MNRIDLGGEVEVVTGGAQSIGAAVAERLAASGATVVVWDLELAAGSKGLAVDVADERSVAEAAAETARRHGPVGVLVNSAGIAGPTAETWRDELAEPRRVQQENLDGTFLCCRALIRAMIERGYGRIVNIASIAGKEGTPWPRPTARPRRR